MLAAEFLNAGKSFKAVWFQHSNGQGDCCTPEGESIKKEFLRSSLEFSRISSGFTDARYNPMLQRWRAHKGINYAAETGTGVKATSDGVVETANYDHSYCNVVVCCATGSLRCWRDSSVSTVRRVTCRIGKMLNELVHLSRR